MEDRVDRLHVEVLFHLYYEEIDHLLVRLQKVYGVVALADEDLTLFARQEL